MASSTWSSPQNSSAPTAKVGEPNTPSARASSVPVSSARDLFALRLRQDAPGVPRLAALVQRRPQVLLAAVAEAPPEPEPVRRTHVRRPPTLAHADDHDPVRAGRVRGG